MGNVEKEINEMLSEFHRRYGFADLELRYFPQIEYGSLALIAIKMKQGTGIIRIDYGSNLEKVMDDLDTKITEIYSSKSD